MPYFPRITLCCCFLVWMEILLWILLCCFLFFEAGTVVKLIGIRHKRLFINFSLRPTAPSKPGSNFLKELSLSFLLNRHTGIHLNRPCTILKQLLYIPYLVWKLFSHRNYNINGGLFSPANSKAFYICIKWYFIYNWQ